MAEEDSDRPLGRTMFSYDGEDPLAGWCGSCREGHHKDCVQPCSCQTGPFHEVHTIEVAPLTRCGDPNDAQHQWCHEQLKRAEEDITHLCAGIVASLPRSNATRLFAERLRPPRQRRKKKDP